MKTNIFPKLSGKGMNLVLIVARFNASVTERLLQGAYRALKESGIPDKDATVNRVPGSFELPLLASQIARKRKIDAIVCLGAIIRGETSHDRHIARAVALGIMEVNLKYGIPVIFGVLTTDNLKQALARSKPDTSNKGYEAVMAAIEMVQAGKAIK